MLQIAFDVDGCLIQQIGVKEDTPRYDVIALYRLFEKFENDLYIWSGGGIDYATRWRDKLGLTGEVVQKGSFKPDIAVDDEEVDLGIVNLRV